MTERATDNLLDFLLIAVIYYVSSGLIGGEHVDSSALGGILLLIGNIAQKELVI
ncbi:MAG: hypothetical protein FWH14_06845 [Oscillospiraceae bacterium]|nr:hypothetical protein [Oscillospiraceae bacterium]